MEEKRGGKLVSVADVIRKSNPVTTIIPKETKDAAKLPKLTKSEFENPQLNLFQSLLCNTDAEHDQLSNAIDLWDNIPRYSISRQAQGKLRINGQFLKRHETEFLFKGSTYTRIVYPARAKDSDGIERDYYPSASEELVEDALRKLAVEQNAGYFDQPHYRSGVVFTLGALRQELEKRGHTRSYKEIVLSLHILSHCVIDIIPEEAPGSIGVSAYLPKLVVVTRKNFREDPKSKWRVEFHPLVTASIDTLTYRQFNYALMMSLTTQLARWLHKQLVLKYTFASLSATFEMRFSTIRRDSVMFESYSRMRDAIDEVEEAFNELKKSGVIVSLERTNVIGPNRKILDAVFKIAASFDFVRDIKAANKRLSLAVEKRPAAR